MITIGKLCHNNPEWSCFCDIDVKVQNLNLSSIQTCRIKEGIIWDLSIRGLGKWFHNNQKLQEGQNLDNEDIELQGKFKLLF